MELSHEEKLNLLTLKDWHTSYGANGKLPEMIMYDGPCGVRRKTPEESCDGTVHCYPAPHVMANSWDKEVAFNVGQAMASDCIDNEIDVNLSPGINIKRTPACGRNFEYFSEDPYLTAELAGEQIHGVQSLGVASSLKHFCCNNREWDRLSQTSEVDLRTLREIYTKATELILKKYPPKTIMCAYNPINGINCAENKFILDEILRKQLGYDGVIISDWDAVHDPGMALKATLDIVCTFETDTIELRRKSLENGIITQEEIDAAADRIVKLCEFVSESRKTRKSMEKEKRAEIAIDGARKGIVLLKNENNVLPIPKGKKISLLGDAVDFPYYTGGGSGGTFIKEGVKGLKECLNEIYPDCVQSKFRLLGHTGMVAGSFSNVRTTYVRNAMNVAYDSDYTVLVVGNSPNDESESFDRTTIKLHPHIEKAILSLAEMTDKLVVVIETGSAIDVSNWIDKVNAVIFAGFAGEGVNTALAEILTGKTNPSGRLSETFPLSEKDLPCPIVSENPLVDRYTEGVFVGYRHYDTKKIPVAFPFGYGLSYSKFEYSDFKCEKLGNTDYKVSLMVKNISEVDGGDVVQLYVRNIDMMVERPNKELRRFEKVYLKAGESRKIEFSVNKDCFEYFNVCYNAWHVDKGRYEIQICRDSSTVEFREKVLIEDNTIRDKILY